MTKTRKSSDSYVEMTELAIPSNANPLGKVLGGYVMHLIDIAGAISASRFCNETVVTASIDSLDFRHSIKVGEVIVLKAIVNWTGRTSMEVGVDVYSEDLKTGLRKLTCSAFLSFVAVDGKGNRLPVPSLALETDEERKCFEEAKVRREARMKRLGKETRECSVT